MSRHYYTKTSFTLPLRPSYAENAMTPGENRALAAACNRLVVVDGIVGHGIPLTPFQSPPNARPCRDRRGEGAAWP